MFKPDGFRKLNSTLLVEDVIWVNIFHQIHMFCELAEQSV
jgi:hypothetical protein